MNKWFLKRVPGISGKKRLTCIETVVAAGLCTVFILFMIPVLLKAQEQSKQKICASHLKQIGIACAMYSQDYGGWELPWMIPKTHAGKDNTYRDSVWFGVLYAYGYLPLPDASAHGHPEQFVTVCPEDTAPLEINIYHFLESYGGPIKGPKAYIIPCSYIYNRLIGWYDNGIKKFVMHRTEEIKDPGGTIRCLDSEKGGNWYTPYGDEANGYDVGGGGKGKDKHNHVASWHNGGTNILWCDGHVSWMKEEEVLNKPELFTIESWD